jgi:6-phospho-beta-glucosidase
MTGRLVMKKIALIGGGSVRTNYFVESLIKFHEKLGIDHISIMDIDEERLRIFGGLAIYNVGKAKSSLKVTLTNCIEEAVADADYVVTTIRVGFDECRCRDERIALNHGVIGQETTGAGGFSYAMRTIPTMLKYMEVIRKKAKPDVIVFNFTNPSGLITQAIYDAGYDNVIGICDNATGIKIDLSQALRVNASDLTVKVYGLNHLSWANSVEAGGVNILPKLMENEGFIQNFHQFLYFDRDLIRYLREIPNGYLYYYYHRYRALKNLLKAPSTRGEFIAENNRQMIKELREHDVNSEPETCLKIYREYMKRREESYMSIELDNPAIHTQPVDIESLGISEIIGSKPYDEIYEGYAGVVFNYIDSMNHNKGLDLAISVPNRGAIPGMEDSDVVEVTCRIYKEGAVPVKFDGINPGNLLLMQTIKRFEKLTVEAALEKNRLKAIEALTIHPLVGDYSLAKQLACEYEKVNEPYMQV